MTTWIKVARFHLADRLSYTALPWGVLAINLAIYLAIAAGANKGGSVQIPSATHSVRIARRRAATDVEGPLGIIRRRLMVIWPRSIWQ